MEPPKAKKFPTEHTYFGITLQDDYAWLREKESSEVIDHLKAENAYMEANMKHTEALQERLYQEMLSKIKETDDSVPVRKGNYWYYTRTEEGRPYPIHCRKKGSMEAAEEILMDENLLAGDLDYFKLGDLKVSSGEQMIAYSVDTNGSEIYSIHFKNLATGEVLAETIEGAAPEVEWGNNDDAVYYATLDHLMRPFKLFRHEMGSNAADLEIYHEADESFFLNFSKTLDEKYIILSLGNITTSEAWFWDLKAAESKLQLFAARKKGVEYSIEHHEGWFYVVTNEEGAVNFKVMRTKVNACERAYWETFIGHDDFVKIDDVSSFENHLVISGRKNGLSNLQIYHFATQTSHDITFGEPVYTIWEGSNPEYRTQKLQIAYSSLLTPVSVFEYDMVTKERKLLKEKEVLGGYDRTQYVSERVIAQSADGTRVPISLVHKKGMKLDGTNPCLLYGYGSYGITVDPAFNSNRFSLLDRGFIFAIAHIRGGGAMGRKWYLEGKFLKKKHTFEDFIACAEHLIQTGYTQAQKLCIMGGSAGGLLMGAVTNLRPDLFQAVIAHVPFVDMMNTMLDPSLPLTVTEYDEWGNPNEEEYFKYMHSYSPYDNVQRQAYPHFLITGGLNDPRVGFWEPAKWCAKLREYKTDDRLLLLKTNMGAGHQGKSGRYGYLREVALDFAFLMDRVGIAE